MSGNHYVEYLSVPEDQDDPDFIVPDDTDDETEVSTFEDPEEIDENELKVSWESAIDIGQNPGRAVKIFCACA